MLMSGPPAHLNRVDPAAPGLSRRRRGPEWSYYDEAGELIDDPAVIARISALVIPPAWHDVWISPDPNGHIQAVGTDVAGRRQYRYHDEWRRLRDREKYDRVLMLGTALPAVRGELSARLQEKGLGRGRVLAAGVRMLDIGAFRSGDEEYAPGDDHEDGTFGLATLRREHVRLNRGAVLFSYPAKGHVPRTLSLRDPLLHKVVDSLLRRHGGGEELLAFRAARGWHHVRAEDLNAAVKELVGPEYTAKDLRTWNATVLAAVALAACTARSGVPEQERARERMVTQAVKEVSEHLGNTPPVARRSYVDPRVLERFDEGATVLPALRNLENWSAARPEGCDDAIRATVERAVVGLISR
jgi:DNA topoisomerase I